MWWSFIRKFLKGDDTCISSPTKWFSSPNLNTNHYNLFINIYRKTRWRPIYMDDLICMIAHPSEDVKCVVCWLYCYDMESERTWHAGRCECSVYVTQVVWLVAHIMWDHNIHNSHFGVCLEGVIIHKKDLESPPCKGGEVIAVSC